MTATSLATRFGRHICGVALCATLMSASALAAERMYYRYINEDGVKVINHSIPPEYAQKGYEVVNVSGQVLKVVPPAIAPEDAERMAAEKAEQERLAKWDADLRRRYSSVKDIEAAKERRLRDMDTSLSILRSNIANYQTQIRAEQAKAADAERQGRKVQQSVLVKISNLQAELEDARLQVEARLKDYDNVAKRYDRDMQRFAEIQAQAQSQ